MVGLPGYRIGGVVYEGVGTQVFHAVREADQLRVIVKLPAGDHPPVAKLARWKYEHEILAALAVAGVPGVVRCYGLAYDRGRPALILEDIDGRSLRTLIAGPMPVARFLPIAVKVAEALAGVHGAGIIHKDVNPNNIVVDEATGAVRLIDFGIASRLPREMAEARSPTLLEGTIAYISPEQTGRMNRAVDHRTDLYSLGVTFYEMLSGVQPFQGNDAMELVHSHLAKLPVPLSELFLGLPPVLDDIVRKLLAKTPEQRYESAFGLLHDLRALERGETSFPLGTRDVSPRLTIPQRLFGRDADVRLLNEAFERVVSGGSEIVVVRGYSGIGKTSLVSELYRPVTLAHGYFLAGKFDQLKRDIPYEAVAQALRQLVTQLVLEGAARVASLRSRLEDALGLDAQVLIDVVPELEQLLGKRPRAPEVGPDLAEGRFHDVVRRFFGVFAGLGQPLVLFLDDLQWADLASLKLLRALADREKTGHLLITLAYRDNEVGEGHPLLVSLAEIQKAGAIPASTITLAPLTVEGVVELCAETLHRPAGDVRGLAAVLHEKTGGNPFFLGQLLTALHRGGLLQFRHEDGLWSWDLDRIAAAETTANVVDLMIARIEKLAPATQEILKLAACTGSRFELSILAAIAERPLAETAAALWEALEDGLILPGDERYRSPETWAGEGGPAIYRFLHDRVQHAAYAMIPEARRRAVRLSIGRLLLAKLGAGTVEGRLFDILGHLLVGIDLVTDPAERIRIADLALRAATKARASLAYETAGRFARQGIELLPEGSFTTHHALAFQLSLERSQCAYLEGAFDEADQLFGALLEKAETLVERAEVYRVRVVLYENASRFQESIRCGIECLRLFGVELDEVPSEAAVGGMLDEVGGLLGGRPIHTLVDLPPLEDPERAALFQVLLSLVAPAYFQGPTIFCAIVTQMVILSMRHGNSPFSAAAYVYFGVVMATFGQHAAGYGFGRLAFDLLARYDAPPIRGKVVFMFGNWLNFRKHHVKTDLDYLVEAFHACVAVGDLTYACYCAIGVVQVWFAIGKNLAEAHQEVPQWLGFARRNKVMDIVDNIATVDHAFKNLLGLTRNASTYSDDEGFDEAEFERHLDADRSVPVQAYQYHHKAFVRYILEDHEAALVAVGEAQKRLAAMAGQMLVEEHAFHQSLILAAAYARATEEERAASREQIQKNLAVLRAIAEHAPMNYAHKQRLVEAELARLEGKPYEAMELYDESVALALEGGFVHHAAVANECAGRFHLGRGKLTHAKAYLTEAYLGYEQWGAVAKVKQMKERHRLLLGAVDRGRAPQRRDLDTATATSFEGPRGLDMLTVTKASQAISREIRLDRLLEQLTRIVVESAGAERGFLVLRRNDELVLAASGEAATGKVELLSAPLVEGSSDLSSAIVLQVARTGHPVVLDDASTHPTYRADPYVRARGVKSLLCLPALNLGKLSAIVYVENNLVEGCFTLARLEVLRILSTQIAISIDHAALYESLEAKVQERTEELRQTQAKLDHVVRVLRS